MRGGRCVGLDALLAQPASLFIQLFVQVLLVHLGLVQALLGEQLLEGRHSLLSLWEEEATALLRTRSLAWRGAGSWSQVRCRCLLPPGQDRRR